MKQFYVILFTLISFTSSAQELLKDIVTSNASSHPRSMVKVDSKQFFVASGIDNRTELWVTNGTTEGTTLIEGVILDSSPYAVNELCALGDKVIFKAVSTTNSSIGFEPWVSDGTTEGTKLLKDINSGQFSSFAGGFLKIGNKVIFTAVNQIYGLELWVTDGTPDGTTLLKDINPNGNSDIYTQTVIGDKCFFMTFSPGYGRELWVTDGLPEGTFMVKDINLGNADSFPQFFTPVGNKLFFAASFNGDNRLCVSDGTELGTTVLYNSQTPIYPQAFVEFNGKVLFSGANNERDRELWISDGTYEGTNLVKNISSTGSSFPESLTKSGSNVLFMASDGVNGKELWRTDGTEVGTYVVKDINPNSTGSNDLTFPDFFKRQFISINSILYFLANSGSEGFELWKSDGTSGGTSLVKDFKSGSASATYSMFTSFGSSLYFMASDNTEEISYWKTDGTLASTVKLTDINTGLSNIFPLLIANNSLFYLVAYGNTTGYELYKSDGGPLSLVKDVATHTFENYKGFNFKASGNNGMIFTYDNNKQGFELWRSDGVSNTSLLKDCNPFAKNFFLRGGYDYYSFSSDFSPIVSFKNYQFVSDGSGALWKIDGANVSPWQASGLIVFQYIGSSDNMLLWLTLDKLYKSTDGINIELVTTIPNLSYLNTQPSLFYEVNGTFYFVFGSGSLGKELWKTDGTQAGTMLVKNISPGSSSTSFSYFRKVGNKLFFVATTDSGAELWVTDGTEAGTYQVKDINPGSNGADITSLTNYNDNLLIFNANDGANGYRIWKSDGTNAGTVMIDPSANIMYPFSDPNGYTNFQGKVFFGASQNGNFVLCSTNGTTITPVKTGLNVQMMIVHDNQLYMRGFEISQSQGYELFKSDGTSEGTVLVKDINPGIDSSNPNNFFIHQNSLYFMANDGTHGNELWVLRYQCVDSLHFASPLNTTLSYKAGKAIVGETANTITSTANVTYDSKKYILLKPGFSTNPGAVFQSKIGGCTPLTSFSNESISTPTKPDFKTEQYQLDLLEQPSIEGFIRYGNSINLKEIWAKFEENLRPLIDKERLLSFELSALEKQKPANLTAKNQQVFGNYYTAKVQKERDYESVKQEIAQYRYFITPIRTDQGEKLGYDLTIYAGGKVYQSSIRN